ncbi:MAG TPA: cupin domain-containing protein [Mycobacterium sp.]|nr:cupin domain-containing protein [Mycobacterium sp.]
MHHVTGFDPAQLEPQPAYADHSVGYRRVSHIDRGVGAIRTGFGTCELAAGGSIDPHVHSYEELVYVVAGAPCLSPDGLTYRISPDDAAFIGVGATHSWHAPDSEPCRWIDLQTPQARDATDPADTFFVPSGVGTGPEPVSVRDPRARFFAHWQPSQMLLDERHGAFLGTMFMVDYQCDVVLHPHDHPVEEAFYMLEGEVVFIADGTEYTLAVGDVAYAGVGCIHAFENRSGKKTRWLETRAPLPPLHHSYRFNRDWDFLAEQFGTA